MTTAWSARAWRARAAYVERCDSCGNQKKVEYEKPTPDRIGTDSGLRIPSALRRTHTGAYREHQLRQFVGEHSNHRPVLRGWPRLQRHSSPCVLQHQLPGLFRHSFGEQAIYVHHRPQHDDNVLQTDVHVYTRTFGLPSANNDRC
jgi:hypothetical protein